MYIHLTTQVEAIPAPYRADDDAIAEANVAQHSRPGSHQHAAPCGRHA